MRIRSVSLKGFKAFQFADIQQFDADFVQPITIVMGSNGAGKQTRNTAYVKVPYGQGWKLMGDVHVGDLLTMPDGSVAGITHVFPFKQQDIYRVHFEDGRYSDCGKDHLWSVHIEGAVSEMRIVMSTEEIIRHFKVSAQRLHIDTVRPELLSTEPDKDLPMDPYLLGELVNHPLNQGDTCIPEMYFNGSWEQRVRLLRGILGITTDAVGLDKREYRTSDYQLHVDVKRLVWSLGGTVRVRTSTGYPTDNNHFDLVEYHCCMTVCLSKHKHVSVPLYITNVECLDVQDDCTCIRVNHPDQLYIVDDYVVTHNSSLLNELTPIPAIRTDYAKDGYKSLVIDHGQDTYTLTSDFTNRSAPHSFKKGDIELNVSGVTQVQTELVQKYFGYTPYIHDLVYMATDLCRMGPAERKNFFLAINPVDLKHVLEQHKKVQSKIKEYKNNLSMLHTRRTEVESKLMTKELLAATYANKETLVDQAGVLDKMIYALTQHIHQLKDTHRTEIDRYRVNGTSLEQYIPTAKVKHLYHALTQFLITHKDIPKDTYEEELYALAVDIQKYTFSLSEYGKAATDIKKEINEYHTHLEATSKQATSNMEAALKEVLSAIEQTPVREDILQLSKEDIADAERVASGELKELCLQCVNKPSTVWTPDQAQKCYSKYDHINNDVNYRSMRLQDIERVLTDIRTEHTSLVATIPKECTLDMCVLKKTQVTKRNQLQQKILELEREGDSIEKKQKRYLRVQSTFGEMCREQMLFTKTFNDVLTLRNKHPSLYRLFTPQSLFDTITSNPTQMLRMVDDCITNSKNVLIRTGLEEKEQLLRKELEVMVKSNTSSVDFLTTILKEKTTQLEQVLKDLTTTEASYRVASERVSTLKQFKSYKEELSVLQQTVDVNGEVLIALKSIEYHRTLLTTCERLKQDIQEQLRGIESKIKEQEALLARYNDEIVKWISKIDASKWKYELIEKALSPSNGIPHRYMVTYINNLIHNVNYFISQVFSYKMNILPVNEEIALDFIFPVELEGGTIVRDISRLSKGQKEMVSIAWVFAILLQMKQLDQFCLFLDEIGSGFDPYHAQKLIEFLRDLVDRKILSQIFVVNHEALVASGFSDGDVIVLRTENVLLPEVYNQHVVMHS